MGSVSESNQSSLAPLILDSNLEDSNTTENQHNEPLPFSKSVLALMVVVVLCGTSNTISRRIALVPLNNYAFFLSQLSSIAYAFIYSAILFYRFRTGIVTREMLSISIAPFIFIGIMDSLGDILGNVGVHQLPGYVIPILAKFNIPFTAAFSWILLNQHLTIGQYVGIVVVISGGLVVILPKLLHPSSEDQQGQITLWACLVYILSVAPTALSFVIKERVFKRYADINLDIFVVAAFVNIFQVLATFLFFPLAAVPHLGQVPLQDLPTFFGDGFKCFVGISSREGDHCLGAPASACIYLLINILYNIAMITLLKYGGALLAFITNTITFPLATLAFAFSWPLLPAVPISFYVVLGLFVEMSGVYIYKFSGSYVEKLLSRHCFPRQLEEDQDYALIQEVVQDDN